ncbi:DUF1501 domain-containing protein [Phenylobacterium aquaticum]|uniref:DUF1501 domain-containing protein n=1 Tax=Phenylobacterium aquaticum TaxID=1763816 RepID=UPI001F5DD6AA|nr:DUF1501 domain-containing protein [Phenylobacterium aquaticum]MCI3131390.1 DUF1501 domain-containing protein [Phenylobacterium aquaticum]
MTLTRRTALAAAAGFGLTLDFMARQAFAGVDAGLARKKLVFVICRGGLDGLSLSPPIGDPDYTGLRRSLALEETALRLDGTFALHPSMTATHALAQAGQARIAPAIATPDRARSHFEAQDVLESGAAAVYGASSGWLNRTVGVLQARRKVDALSIGATTPLVLRGPAAASSWSPGAVVDAEARLPTLLQDLYKDDPLLGPAFARGLATETMAQTAMADGDMPAMQATTPPAPAPGASGVSGLVRQGQDAAFKLGETTAGFMREPNGPQIIAVSLDGFDTHAGQAGQLAPRLAYLDALLDGLHTGLGPDWKDTLVLVATEFGRTARINGTGGTDHGTASTALILGGGLKPGGIVGDWPTLKTSALFENRDLAPTLDMRSLFKGALAEQLGLERAALDTTIFPDSTRAAPVAGLV